MDIKIGYFKKGNKPQGVIIRIDEKDGNIFIINAKTGKLLFRKQQPMILEDFTPESLVFLGVDCDTFSFGGEECET